MSTGIFDGQVMMEESEENNIKISTMNIDKTIMFIVFPLDFFTENRNKQIIQP